MDLAPLATELPADVTLFIISIEYRFLCYNMRIYPFINMSAALVVLPTALFSMSVGIAVDREVADR